MRREITEPRLLVKPGTGGCPRQALMPGKPADSNSSRPAEAEELCGVRGRNGQGSVRAVIGDGGGGHPACRGGQRAGLFQRETGRDNGSPGSRYLRVGAKRRKRG